MGWIPIKEDPVHKGILRGQGNTVKVRRKLVFAEYFILLLAMAVNLTITSEDGHFHFNRWINQY